MYCYCYFLSATLVFPPLLLGNVISESKMLKSPQQTLVEVRKHYQHLYESLEPPSKFKIQNMKYAIWNSKYVFGIPNTYSEFQIRIWNSKYPIRNSKYVFGIPNTLFGIPNTLFGIPNSYLEFQICYSEF